MSARLHHLSEIVQRKRGGGRACEKAVLLELAKAIGESSGVAVERIHRRRKDALVAWFCVNAPRLLEGRAIDLAELVLGSGVRWAKVKEEVRQRERQGAKAAREPKLSAECQRLLREGVGSEEEEPLQCEPEAYV
jgi:hypothetical protein